MTQKTLVTCALPYANGPIHLGHMVEHVQTDIFVRYLKSKGVPVTSTGLPTGMPESSVNSTLLALTDVRTALHDPAWDLTQGCRRDR